MKIKNGSHRGIISATELESEESERFHFFRLRLRLHHLRSGYELVKTSLSESEAEAEGLTNHHYDITLISQVTSKKVTFNTILIFCKWHLCIRFLHCVMARQLLYAYRIPVRLIAVLQSGFTLVFATLVNWHVFVPLG